MGTKHATAALVFFVVLLLAGPAVAEEDAAGAVTNANLGGNSFDYGQVLGLSYLFYEAQRSGNLPGNQRVRWRGNSALNDKGPDGEDLTGGYYDAGDYMKFGVTESWTTAMLAWSIVEFPQGIAAAGQTENAFAALRWGSDYLLKCVIGPDKIVAQVGYGQSDHNLWRRAEDVTEYRKGIVCTPGAPGSDVAAGIAGALALTALAYRGRDKAYADRCLSKAKMAYDFANKYRGFYHDKCDPDAFNFYRSWSYNDDLAWAALWLKRATGDKSYLDNAIKHYHDHKANDNFNDWRSRKYGFFWDSYSPGVALLLWQETGGQEYRDHWRGFVDAWTQEKSNDHVTFSPAGYAWYIKDLGWGNLRHMGNAAFLALVGAKSEGTDERNRIVCWAHGQLHYALGEAGRSYVVGYGNNPPQKPHHRGASCPDAPAGCNYNAVWAPHQGTHNRAGVGAGGPDNYDKYNDDRGDARTNEVAIDYNSGFTGALAGLIQAPVDYGWCKARGMQRAKRS